MSKAEERSKEIMQAALDYANNLDDIKPTDEFRRNLCILLAQAFMKGAEWADEHYTKDSFKKYLDENIWNDASEDVGNNKPILVLDEEGRGVTTDRERLIRGWGEWGKGFCRWAYVEDLLPDNHINKEKV